MMTRPLVFVCAGGTGGHLFPAQALASALNARGIEVDLVTDERATKYGQDFPARQTHLIAADTVRSKNPIALAKTALSIGRGVLAARALIRRERPVAVVGFGGYPTLPPLLAATFLKVPTLIHEANGVMGRANAWLAPRVTAIATSFPGALNAHPALAVKATATGNPVRPNVIAAADIRYDIPSGDSPVRLLVFGGSQGARVMADVVPPAIELLSPQILDRLQIVQQARDEDHTRVTGTYTRLGLRHDVRAFFTELPGKMALAQLVVARSGAGTVAELAAIGRPSILIPLPHALDNDQLANATLLAKAGGAVLMQQQDFTPKALAETLTGLIGEPGRLATMALGARRMGAPDAAERLASLVLQTAGLTQTGV
jgi:UDP-N-acetylglucosamine--N-acetylmuramyl-(pentapeptide) pyrophosphoryl-undecaprenol N-acetylglucosamine transferase